MELMAPIEGRGDIENMGLMEQTILFFFSRDRPFFLVISLMP